MTSLQARAYNRWSHLREATIFQVELLEREGVITADIAERLRAAL